MGLQKKLSAQLKGNLPFELSLSMMADDGRDQRVQDVDSLNKFNSDVKEWANETVASLKTSIGQNVQRNYKLSDSLKANIYKKNKETNRVGFSFAREGIYIHKGAGKRQGGYIGSKWITKKGEEKFRSPDSAGRMGKGRRRPILWFNPVIDRKLPQLADIISGYSADIVLDSTNIYIDE